MMYLKPSSPSKSSPFDVPIHGLAEEYCDVCESVTLANQYAQTGNRTAAIRIWADAVEVGNDEAAFRLATVLKDVAHSSPTPLILLRRSECLLLGLWKRYTDYRIDLELADLYFHCGSEKYASALAHLLWAKLEGTSIPAETVRAYQSRMDDVSKDPHGAYLLGKALLDAGSTEKGIYYLEQALKYGGNGSWVGCAALDLAQAYAGQPGRKAQYKQALKLAYDLGNPEILYPQKQNNAAKAAQNQGG